MKTKTIVVGIIQRVGELMANVIDGTSGEILKKFIHENLEIGNQLNTDDWLGYKGLSKIFDHNVVKHNSKEYVKGDIHTNTIEGF